MPNKLALAYFAKCNDEYMKVMGEQIMKDIMFADGLTWGQPYVPPSKWTKFKWKIDFYKQRLLKAYRALRGMDEDGYNYDY